jgi:hypothetical protein
MLCQKANHARSAAHEVSPGLSMTGTSCIDFVFVYRSSDSPIVISSYSIESYISYRHEYDAVVYFWSCSCAHLLACFRPTCLITSAGRLING